MKQPLAIVRGTTKTMSICVTDENGSAYTLSSNEVLRFGVKKSPCDDVYLFSKEILPSDLVDGAYAFSINPGDTDGLDFGCYYYDVGLQSGNAYFNIIECSEFRLDYNVTRMEVG